MRSPVHASARNRPLGYILLFSHVKGIESIDPALELSCFDLKAFRVDYLSGDASRGPFFPVGPNCHD
jgi:hypothetical protein